MENRKARRASARESARWESQAAVRVDAVDRKQREKQPNFSGAGEGEDLPIPGRKPATEVSAPETDWMPLQAIVGMAATGFPAYIVAEASLSTQPHPLHWLVALLGGGIGYLGGLAFYRRRGY